MEPKKKRRRKRNFSSDTDNSCAVENFSVNCTQADVSTQSDETSIAEIINNEPIGQNNDLEKKKEDTADEYYFPDVVEKPYCLIL